MNNNIILKWVQSKLNANIWTHWRTSKLWVCLPMYLRSRMFLDRLKLWDNIYPRRHLNWKIFNSSIIIVDRISFVIIFWFSVSTDFIRKIWWNCSLSPSLSICGWAHRGASTTFCSILRPGQFRLLCPGSLQWLHRLFWRRFASLFGWSTNSMNISCNWSQKWLKISKKKLFFSILNINSYI